MRKIPPRFKALLEKSSKTPPSSYEHINLLALLFRRIKTDLYLSAATVNKLMVVYLKDPRSRITLTHKAQYSEQSNLKRGLAHPGLTVKNFTKGLRMVRPYVINFTLTLTFRERESITVKTHYSQDKLFSYFHNEASPDNFNFLRILWNKVYAKMGFSDVSWKKQVFAYLDCTQSATDRPNGKSSECSNLNRGLKCPNMTIENFTKAINMINPKDITLTVNLKLSKTKGWTEHSATLKGSMLSCSPFDDEDNHGDA